MTSEALRHSVIEVQRHKGTEVQRHKETANSNDVVRNGHTCLYFFLVKLLILFFVFAGGIGCGDSDQRAPASLPTRGELVIGIDESLKPFADAEIDVFSDDYPEAKITPLYLPEKRVVEKLLANEIQTGIICRNFEEEEFEYLNASYGHPATTVKLGHDDIVVVVNAANPIDTIQYGDLEKILSGTTENWGQLAPPFKDRKPITVVMPSASSIDRHVSSLTAALSGESVYALDTTSEVMDYVTGNVTAMGLVGGSWLLEKRKELPGVKLVALSGGDRFNTREKGLSREVYAVTHEPFTGLGSGFISFMAGQKGQLILSKAGLIPYQPIDREIQISESYQEW